MADLTGKQKAAAVLASVDDETAAAVLKNLSEQDLTVLTREMHALGRLDPKVTRAVLNEFSIRAAADSGSISVDPTVLRERLVLALGPDTAKGLLREIGVDDDLEAVFGPLAELSPEDLYQALADEHPQTAALVLGQMPPKQAAAVVQLFQPEIQVDVIRRMSAGVHADDRVLKRIGELIRSKVSAGTEGRRGPDDPRYKRVAEVVNLLGQDAEERILKELADDEPELADKIRQMMFVFEDLRSLSDADMRQLLMSVDTQVLAMALKTASEELKEKIFANLSRRASETVREELELLGPRPLSQVKAAQQQIVETVRTMETSGQINLRNAKYEEDPLV